MIKIEKDLSKIPASLSSAKTNQRRNEVIEKGKYVYDEKYDGRYRMKDIRERLEEIYHHKCAYCEQGIRDHNNPIEHYRPKSKYFWLAYSWDNLLLCCDKCNVHKGKKFENDGLAVAFHPNDLSDIHSLSKKYNDVEKPKMIHPELEDIESDLVFSEKGDVKSENVRAQYTISTCKVDRKSANERRKTIFDDFKNKIRSKVREYQIGKDPENFGKIKGLIEDFVNDANDPNKEYLAFRRWIIKNTGYFSKDKPA